MKNNHLFLLAFIGSIIAAIGFFIRPELHPVLKFTILALAGVILIAFYLLTFNQMLHKKSIDSSKRIFWTIAIVCLPFIGNILYLILNDMSNT